MLISGTASIYGVSEEMIPSNLEANSATQPTDPSSFFYDLSLLSDKVQQVQSLASIFLTHDNNPQPEATAVAIPAMGTLIQEILITASSMMFACQQMSIGSMSTNGQANDMSGGNRAADDQVHGSYYSYHHGGMMDQWCGENYNNGNSNHIDVSGTVDVSLSNEVCGRNLAQKTEMAQGSKGVGIKNCDIIDVSGTVDVSLSNEVCGRNLAQKTEMAQGSKGVGIKNCDIIELEAAGLLAKYTHYCHVCGKGFKRDANLRMHMRAHGEEYKSSAALCNPMKNNADASGGNNDCTSSSMRLPKKYSCPQEGCRWNKSHAKFQPLKSLICVKNHYRRSHCPKMYVCKRCHKKNFSVLSDLRTHEKHCGDLKWQCSCGTTFSRKDKLMGHLALFVGHAPAVNSMTKINGLEARS